MSRLQHPKRTRRAGTALEAQHVLISVHALGRGYVYMAFFVISRVPEVSCTTAYLHWWSTLRVWRFVKRVRGVKSLVCLGDTVA